MPRALERAAVTESIDNSAVSTLRERLELAIRYGKDLGRFTSLRGLAQVARESGHQLADSWVGVMLSRDLRADPDHPVDAAKLEIVADVCGVSRAWLRFGVGEPTDEPGAPSADTVQKLRQRLAEQEKFLAALQVHIVELREENSDLKKRLAALSGPPLRIATETPAGRKAKRR